MKINEVIGINLGKNMDQLLGQPNPAIIFKNARRFFNIEDIYKDKDGNGVTPASGKVKTYPDLSCDNLVPDPSDGWQSYHDSYKRYNCDYHKFDHEIYAFQYIAPDGPEHMRFFPANNVDPKELGATSRKQTINSFQMADIVKQGFRANEIEANEHWRPGYIPTYKAMQKGFFMAQDDDFKVNSQALQFLHTDEGNPMFHNYGPDYLTPDELSQTNALTIHPYGFKNGQGGKPEDLIGRPEHEIYQNLKKLKEFRDANAPQAKMYVTEIGWNSEISGEQNQAEYLIISLLLAMDLGYSKFHIYELIDRPKNGLFNSCGLGKIVDGKYVAKESYYILKDFLEQYGEYTVGKVYQIDREWSVDLIPPTGDEIIVVSWSEDESGLVFEKVSDIEQHVEDVLNGVTMKEEEVIVLQTAIGILTNQDIMKYDSEKLVDKAIEISKLILKKTNYGK